MIKAQNLKNWSHDSDHTPFRGVCHPWARLATINLPTKFEVSKSTYCEDM